VNKTLFYLCLILLLSSCHAYKDIVYVQDAGRLADFTDTTHCSIPDPILKQGDLLVITVNATTPEAALPFNLPLIPGQGNNTGNYDPSSGNISSAGSTGSGTLQNYLIDTQGNINFPVLGKVHAVGMTKNQLADYIVKQIHPKYIKEDPIVNIRFANFKISVLGEVARPGAFSINNEEISLFEAIALAGDLTIYGKRDNVLLIREGNDGKRQTTRIDLRDSRLINSPWYYLQQNDVLYVQPNNPKSRASGFSTAETISISVVGTLISVASLIVTLAK